VLLYFVLINPFADTSSGLHMIFTKTAWTFSEARC